LSKIKQMAMPRRPSQSMKSNEVHKKRICT
jgi:hypothetical protein